MRPLRARRGIDVARVGKAVERPGIDPREWIKIGTVKEVGFDAAEGVFADVLLQPQGVVETCYVGTSFAGSVGGKVGFGDWEPLAVGDTVVVAVPDGDTNAGPVVICRLWNRGDPPPSQIAGSEPDPNRWIIAKPGTNISLLATLAGLLAAGGCQVDVEPGGLMVTAQVSPAVSATFQLTPQGISLTTSLLQPVLLGDSSAQPLAKAPELVEALTAVVAAFTTISAFIDNKFVMSPGGNPTWTDMNTGIAVPLEAAVAAIAPALALIPCLKVSGS